MTSQSKSSSHYSAPVAYHCVRMGPVSLDLLIVFKRDAGNLDFNVFSLKKLPL